MASGVVDSQFGYISKTGVYFLVNQTGWNGFTISDWPTDNSDHIIGGIGSFNVLASNVTETTKLRFRFKVNNEDGVTRRVKFQFTLVGGTDLQGLNGFTRVYDLGPGIAIDEELWPVRAGNDSSVYSMKLSFTDEPLTYPDCDNIPDGQAAITLLVKSVGDGQVLGVQRNFDFRNSDHSFNFFDHWNNNPFGALGDFIIYGYRVKSSAGFTSGTIQILETWSYAPGIQQSAFNIDRGSIQLSDGKTHGFLKVEQWSRTSILEGLPKYFDGTVSVVCNFADLPDCNDDVYEGQPDSDEIFIQNNDFSTSINESIEIHITDGEGLTEELTKIDEPIQPSEPPPELNCECQVYQAKLIYEGLCYLQKTIDVRMAQLMVAFNANQKQLIQVLVEGLRPLVTTEEGPRGLADVLSEKELDPIFLVDTNECFYKKTMPPDGDAWIGDMP